MPTEFESYEAGWRYCARCGTRRPLSAMTQRDDGIQCAEAGWCLKQRPVCPICGEPVESMLRGRKRTIHEACKPLARKIREAGQ